MKRLSVALMLVVASSVFAQEIGTEITPVTPDSSANKPKQEPPPPDTSTNQNTTDSNPWGSKGSSSSKKKDEAKKAATSEAPREGMVSAGAGAFGIRASYGPGGQLVGAASGTAQPTPVGTVGLSYWATDGFTLLIDVGFGMALSPSFALGFAGIVGMDYHFGSVGEALRPLINVQAGVVTGVGGDPVSSMALTVQAGAGAEYFFSPQFSVSGRIGLGFRLGFTNGSALLGLVTPSIGAAWYY
ncbi:MAG: hypothetical protein SFW67_30260 [Myxococcaceae bacterium]|nr:hypothetical protein [Myxococcaceae bacterium]